MSSEKLPKGYKQTEVGVIPNDWAVVTAEQICELVVDCKNRTPPVIEGGDFAVVRTPNVRHGRFVREDLRFTDQRSFKEWTARAVPQIGDILITREAPLGEVCHVPKNLRVCLGQRMMLYRPDFDRIDSSFFLYSLMAPMVQSCLQKKIGGSTVGHAKVDDIRNLAVPFPPTKVEQEAIATSLSDTDALIEALGQLIAKKRHIKQGTMQELLTGKRRLPGFGERKGYKQTEVGVIPEDWKVVTADQICELVVDCKNRTPPVIEGGDFAVVRTPNVRHGKFVREDLRFTDKYSFVEWTARAVPQIGDILITREAPLGEVCLVPENLQVCLGQRMMLYRPDFKKLDSSFLLYVLMAPAVQNCLQKKIGGSTVGHAKVDDIRNLAVPIPPTKAEQEAIATILSDMDTEIATLEAKLTKTRQLKQGMMHNLLTGRIRLV